MLGVRGPWAKNWEEREGRLNIIVLHSGGQTMKSFKYVLGFHFEKQNRKTGWMKTHYRVPTPRWTLFPWWTFAFIDWIETSSESSEYSFTMGHDFRGLILNQELKTPGFRLGHSPQGWYGMRPSQKWNVPSTIIEQERRKLPGTAAAPGPRVHPTGGTGRYLKTQSDMWHKAYWLCCFLWVVWRGGEAWGSLGAAGVCTVPSLSFTCSLRKLPSYSAHPLLICACVFMCTDVPYSLFFVETDKWLWWRITWTTVPT